MCGFAGVVAWDERYRTSRATLEKMSAAVAHRGPDGEGMWFNFEEGEIAPDRPQVALAHRRLAIIDPDPRANQPFTDGEGRWIVFNGEIYNFRELRAELKSLSPGYKWRTDCDTEVLLAAYAAWGEQCVVHLNGMFAFAVWDENDQSLFLARDRMGQKPLYVAGLPDIYAETATHSCDTCFIAFASELPALIQVPHWDRGLSFGVPNYLSLGYFPNGTVYRGASKVVPSTTLTVRRDRIEARDYFRSYAGVDDARPPHATVDDTRRLVMNAVRTQLVSDVPLGCFLSGGVDSSVVALAMTRCAPSPADVRSFSIAFDDPRYDESTYAGAVARHLGTTHRTFTVRPHVADDLPGIAAVFGEPFADSSVIPTHYLCRAARAHVTVALSGDGADELFGGYDRYRAMRLAARLPSFAWRAIRAAVAAVPSGGSHPKDRCVRARRFLESAALPPAERYARYVRIFQREQIEELIGRSLEHSPDNIEGLFALGLLARGAVPNALSGDRVSYLPDDLLVKVDRASMLHALEVRSPFMDHELVQFAAGLTTDQLLKGGPKRMLREAFADDLPAWVFKRKKMGFAVPIGDWFRGELRPMLRDHLFAANAFGRSHFNMNVVERLVEEHETQRVDHSQRLYALLMLELWWRSQ